MYLEETIGIILIMSLLHCYIGIPILVKFLSLKEKSDLPLFLKQL